MTDDNLDDTSISPELLARIKSIKAKRPKVVLDHILQYGFVTNEDLKTQYGYDHPPRAIRDVREQGIQLETFRVKGSNNRMIGAYKLKGGLAEGNNKAGRRQFPKRFKVLLLSNHGQQCALCGGKFPGNTLQIDHKVPYEVAGDKMGDLNPGEFMLLCGSCNRTKSWECEHCDNWKNAKIADICNTCMFGSPNKYEHIAMQPTRSLTLTWNGGEVKDFDDLQKEATEANQSISDYTKDLLRRRYALFLRRKQLEG